MATPVTLETLLQIDARVWPIAALAFLRIVTVFLFLPVFGEQAIPTRLRIGLSILFTIVLWPSIENSARIYTDLAQWTPGALGLLTLREVFFGFAAGFAARLVVFATSIASELVGTNMGFQAASLYNPQSGQQESAYAAFKGWLVLMCLLAFNVHHPFLVGLADSFLHIPIGQSPDGGSLAAVAVKIVESSFLLGIRLAAPLLLVQVLVTFALGLLARAIPQLNAFVMQFPLSFLVSMVVLFLSAAAFVRLLGGAGLGMEQHGYISMQKAFTPSASTSPAGGQ